MWFHSAKLTSILLLSLTLFISVVCVVVPAGRRSCTSWLNDDWRLTCYTFFFFFFSFFQQSCLDVLLRFVFVFWKATSWSKCKYLRLDWPPFVYMINFVRMLYFTDDIGLRWSRLYVWRLGNSLSTTKTTKCPALPPQNFFFSFFWGEKVSGT